jgi:hypothetical protein
VLAASAAKRSSSRLRGTRAPNGKAGGAAPEGRRGRGGGANALGYPLTRWLKAGLVDHGFLRLGRDMLVIFSAVGSPTRDAVWRRAQHKVKRG